jgi:hypothetical protein
MPWLLCGDRHLRTEPQIGRTAIHARWQRPVADIDALILGNPDRDELYAALSAAEQRLGRSGGEPTSSALTLDNAAVAFSRVQARQPVGLH